MKLSNYLAGLCLFLVLLHVSEALSAKDQVKLKEKAPTDNGIAFAFSGAGGRIAQHIATMKALMTGNYPAKTPIRPSYVSGASAGAISAVALNAVLEAQEKNITNGFTWEKLEAIILGLKTKDVYDNSYEGLAKILAYNIFEGYFLDNSPLRAYLTTTFQEMGYTKFGDLYLPTAITVVNQSSGNDLRMWSTDPRYKDLNLVDLLMATTAMPMAFPPTTIPGLGDTVFIDGGTGIDTIPIEILMSDSRVKEMYLFAYSGCLQSDAGSLPSYLEYLKLLRNGLATIDAMRVDLFAGAIDITANSRKLSYAYIPVLNETFSSLDFDAAPLQYKLAYAWAVNNNPSHINVEYAKQVEHEIYNGKVKK